MSYLYAGVAGYVGRPEAVGKIGVFRKPASGGEWQNVLPSEECFAVAVHPKDANTVLAGTTDGVWISSDAGATFKKAKFPDAKKQIWSFLVDSRDGNRILAGASPIDIYRSDDKGQSWRKTANPNVPSRCTARFEHRVMRMVQHPTRPDEVYAALEIAGACMTTNFGDSWVDCSPHLVELSEKHEQYKSKIASDSFAEGMLDGHAITMGAGDPDAVLFANRMGLFESRDKGRTWVDKDVKRFSPVSYGRDVKVSPQDPKTVYCALSVAAASKDGAVFKSSDAGRTWKRFDKVQVHGTVMSIGLSNSDPKKVLIGARYEGEIFGTDDGGETWKAIPLPGPVKDIYAVTAS